MLARKRHASACTHPPQRHQWRCDGAAQPPTPDGSALQDGSLPRPGHSRHFQLSRPRLPAPCRALAPTVAPTRVFWPQRGRVCRACAGACWPAADCLQRTSRSAKQRTRRSANQAWAAGDACGQCRAQQRAAPTLMRTHPQRQPGLGPGAWHLLANAGAQRLPAAPGRAPARRPRGCAARRTGAPRRAPCRGTVHTVRMSARRPSDDAP